MLKHVLGIILSCWIITPIGSFAGESLIGRVYDWPPNNFMQNGQWVGSNVDAYKALTSEAGVPLELQDLPWSRAMHYMKSQPLLMAQLAPTDERKEFMTFIGPHAKEEMCLALDKQYAIRRIENLDDLAALARESKRMVAYQKNVFYSKAFHERIDNDPDFKKCFEEKATVDTVFKMIKTKRLLGFFDDKQTLAYRIQSEQYLEDIVIHPSFVLSSTDVYFGVSKTVSEVTLKKLKEANERLLTAGKYRQINEKWEKYFQQPLAK